jgi:hypothetical protein
MEKAIQMDGQCVALLGLTMNMHSDVVCGLAPFVVRLGSTQDEATLLTLLTCKVRNRQHNGIIPDLFGTSPKYNHEAIIALFPGS